MQPLNFPEGTHKLAKNQPEYRPLPVCIRKTDRDDVLQYTFKYELSDMEIYQIIKTRSLYFSQFGNCFHPVFASVESPFGTCLVTYQKIDKNYYNFWIPMKDASVRELNNICIDFCISEIMSISNLRADQILFVEKPKMGIDEQGNMVEL